MKLPSALQSQGTIRPVLTQQPPLQSQRTLCLVQRGDEVQHVLKGRVHAGAQIGGEGVDGVALLCVLKLDWF